MHAHQFWWAWTLRFRRYSYSQKRQICIHTNFGGCDFSGFGDIATSAIVHGHQKIQLFRIGMHISFAIHAALVRVSVRVGLKS